MALKQAGVYFCFFFFLQIPKYHIQDGGQLLTGIKPWQLWIWLEEWRNVGTPSSGAVPRKSCWSTEARVAPCDVWLADKNQPSLKRFLGHEESSAVLRRVLHQPKMADDKVLAVSWIKCQSDCKCCCDSCLKATNEMMVWDDTQLSVAV